MLGFNLSSRPGVHAHVEALKKRFRKRYWCLYHLRKAGFLDGDLAKVYRSVILPIADYCSPGYHSLLTDEQDQAIERLQSQALRCIYGPDVPYAEMRRRAGVATLRQRRIESCDKFAAKCLGSKNFSHWFPEKRSARSSQRRGEKFVEEYARCDRLKNSPNFFMRRRLNGKPGKYYGERKRKYRDT